MGGEYSQERFYQATTISTAVSRALNKGNTTIAGGFAFSLNRPQLHPFQETRSQRSPSAYVAVTQTLTKTTAVQLGYELDYVSGYQSNPFLRAIVDGTWQLGVSPDTRRRQALTARLRQALPAGTFLEADYRRYLDSWSMHSDTLSVGLSHRFTSSLLVSGAFRHYGQTGAFFYQSAYTGTPQFFTGDFRLAPFDSKLYTLKLALTPNTSWLHLPADTAFTLQLERYESTSGFKADILSTGIRIPLKR